MLIIPHAQAPALPHFWEIQGAEIIKAKKNIVTNVFMYFSKNTRPLYGSGYQYLDNKPQGTIKILSRIICQPRLVFDLDSFLI